MKLVLICGIIITVLLFVIIVLHRKNKILQSDINKNINKAIHFEILLQDEKKRFVKQLENERKAVKSLLEGNDIMEIFHYLYHSESIENCKSKLAKLWLALPYYPPDWEFRKYLVRLRDNNTCQGCHCNFDTSDRIPQVHHIIPLSERGTNEIKNLILLCDVCHRELHDQHFNYLKTVIDKIEFEWPEFRLRILDRRYMNTHIDTDNYYNIPFFENWSDYEDSFEQIEKKYRHMHN